MPRRATPAMTQYDTADRRLASWGVTLSCRVGEDDKRAWTLSLPGVGSTKPLRIRREWLDATDPQRSPEPLDDLAALVSAFARRAPLAPVRQRRGPVPAEVEPASGSTPRTAGDLVQAAINSSVRRLITHDPLVRIGTDDEGVHQARVATRRLRSDLVTFAPFVDPAWVQPLRAELRWLAALLGAVRDADVMAGRLRRSIETLVPTDRSSASPVERSIEADRDRARVALLDAISTDRYLSLLDALIAAANNPHLTPAAAQHAEPSARRRAMKRWARLERVANDAPDDAALHGIRIAAKQTRYALEAGRAVLGRPAANVASALGEVQDVLGELHDASVAEARLRALVFSRPRPPTATAVAVGQLIAAERAAAAAARAAWPRAWKKARRAAEGFA